MCNICIVWKVRNSVVYEHAQVNLEKSLVIIKQLLQDHYSSLQAVSMDKGPSNHVKWSIPEHDAIKFNCLSC